MKRSHIYILISLLVITTTIIFLANSGDDTMRKYPYGKDTLEFFGDGTFQIYRGEGAGEPPILYTHQIEAPNTVIDNVLSYKIEENIVYVVGENSFIKLDSSTNTYVKKKRISDFTSEDREIFNELMEK
ncbi:hypothetical protein AV545_03460 [Paenibacillus jamilae]|uniref:hypothetical protein n=1 Tax=Paenibacillus jamilae TaxID=114136 RepID=UPI0007AB8279|nr:hypothetical protein [Paenibacillus jamilae]KZE66694.1 hypothetical protein AV545_03460 [Paenibacillus jamilae]